MKVKSILLKTIHSITIAGFALSLSTTAYDWESDEDFEVEKREFSDEELQDFTLEDLSDLEFSRAENYDLDIEYWEYSQEARNRPPSSRSKNNHSSSKTNGFTSVFKDLFNFSKDTTENEATEDSQLRSGYFPSNPLNESYSGKKLHVDVYKQTGAGLPEMIVAKIDGTTKLVALASTARSGKSTSAGTYYGIHYRNMRHRSSLYNNSPMPYALFFNGNIAFHGILENYYPYLGSRASAGCVRLQVDDALRLWRMAKAVRMNVVTKVHSAGSTPPEWELASIRVAAKENYKQRDYYITKYQSNKYRSPYWPTGYFKGHGIRP